jgi:16S rRNA (adenine1518-N6/adenine1519-N6)-dimethyltransferase
MANKFLGQYFLRNASIAKTIVDAIAPERGDIIFEIGPGNGELTIPLSEKCAEAGCRIVAIEKDVALADRLRQQIQKNVDVIEGDVLAALPAQVAALRSTSRGGKYKIVGNIPYYLTGHLLRIVSELKNKPERCVFMVQKEVAERIVAQPPRMNRLAASVQFWANPKIICAVPKSDFVPPPNVDSAVLLLDSTGDASDTDRYYAAVRAIFAQPRKTLLNNVAAASGDKELAVRTLQKIGVDPGARPQNLSVTKIAAIARVLFGDNSAP